MGEASLSLVRLELDRTSELLVSLSDPAQTGKAGSSSYGNSQQQLEYLGQVELSVRLEPKRSADRSSSVLSSLSHGERRVSSTTTMNKADHSHGIMTTSLIFN